MKADLKKNRQPNSIEGFALVITLIMVALAAILAITLLSSATIERTTSKSVDDRYHAELAVQNGLEASKKALLASPDAASAVTKDDTFLVLRANGNQTNANGTKDAYYFMAKARPGTANVVDCYPLFAGGAPSQVTIDLAATPAVQTPQAPTAAFSNPAQDSGGKPYPQLLSFQKPAYTQWQEIHDANDPATAPPYNVPYQRYTFWVEDLAGYLDANFVGNTDDSGKHQRINGTNAKETALFTIFDPNDPSDRGNTHAKDLIDNRALLFTVPTLKQIPPTSGTDLTQPNLAVRLGIDTGGEQNLIPFGYGYPNEGTPEANINSLIAAKNVDGIATAVGTALPNFKTRAGGLPTTFDYAKNLAANIIDYADPNNAPTTDSSTYRGLGAFPLLVSAYDLNNWVSTSQNNGVYYVNIEVTTYVQIWNPHNVIASAGPGELVIHYDNVDVLDVNGDTVNYTAPPDYANGAAFSVSPNVYKVIVFPVKTYNFEWGPTPPASDAHIPFPQPTTANNLRLTWKGKVADRTYQKVQRPFASTGMKYNAGGSTGNWVWRGNAAPPIYPTDGTPGDPRISFYLNRSWTDANYEDNSCWGGRLILTTVGAKLQPSIWPDSGHDSTLGKKPTHSVKPDAAAGQVSLTAADANMWTSRLSTRGAASLETVAELGNIFDPGQWNYPIPSTNSTTSLPDIPASATASSAAGGGYSLCIGRPEFSKFDVNGQRAWQLVDIFALGTRRDTIGLVNLNTAAFEALRALAVGILQKNDVAIQPTSLTSDFYPPTATRPTTSEDQTRSNGAQADLFAQAVIDSRPLLSTAQLNTVKNSIGPFFGNPKQWTEQTPPTEWNDSGREELFSKMLNLSTVRSRNFRVFVTGQSLDKNGKVLSTVSKVFQVFLKPQRGSGGSISTQTVEIKYEAFL